MFYVLQLYGERTHVNTDTHAHQKQKREREQERATDIITKEEKKQ